MVIAGTVIEDGRIVWGPDGEPDPAAERIGRLWPLVLRRLAWAATECPGAELTTMQLQEYLHGYGRAEIERALAGPSAAGLVTCRIAHEAVSRSVTRTITRAYWKLTPHE